MSDFMPITSEHDQCLRWPDSSIWTRSRVEVRKALFEIAPYLAELYQGAVLLLYQCSIPGRARLIAHAVREIGNVLPEKMTGQSFPKRFDPTNLLDEIVIEWKKSGFSIGGGLPLPNDAETDTIWDKKSVEVPQKFIEKISKLIKGYSQSRTSNKDKAVELFKACDPQNPRHIEVLIPVLKQWLDVVQWFVGLAHDRERLDEEILQGRLPAQFDVFETGLRAMTTDCFGTVSEELDEILENANS